MTDYNHYRKFFEFIHEKISSVIFLIYILYTQFVKEGKLNKISSLLGFTILE